MANSNFSGNRTQGQDPLHSNRTSLPESPLATETSADRWNRIQQCADQLLSLSPVFERHVSQPGEIRSPAESLAPLAALEKWARAAVEALKPEGPRQASAPSEVSVQTPASRGSTSQSEQKVLPAVPSGKPADPTAQTRTGQPAFLSADPRMRAALNRIQEKTVEAAKSRIRPGSKLVRPGLDGFRRDEIPVIESSDIKPAPADSRWEQSQANATRLLRSQDPLVDSDYEF